MRARIASFIFIISLIASCEFNDNKADKTNCKILYQQLFNTYESLDNSKTNRIEFDKIYKKQDSLIEAIKQRCKISQEIIDLVYTRDLFLGRYKKAIIFLENIPDSLYVRPYDKVLKTGVLQMFELSKNNDSIELINLKDSLLVYLSNFSQSPDSVYLKVLNEYIRNIPKDTKEINGEIENLEQKANKTEYDMLKISFLRKLIFQKEHNVSLKSNEDRNKVNKEDVKKYLEEY